MKTNFKNYLKIKKAQQEIDKIAKEYEGKNIIIFGIDLLTGDLFRNYDLSQLNIMAISDISYETETKGEFYGYKKIKPSEIIEQDFSLLLITTFDDIDNKLFLKRNLFKNKKINFKIKTLIKMNLFEYIKALINGDI